MTTEYRRGIPSTAHVEAATRLGLLWRGSDEWLHRFRNQNGQIEVWYFVDPNETPDWEAPDFAIEDLDFRPIRFDGTLVDWEVLDREVARVGQQGQPLVGRDADGSQFAINTDGSRSPLPAQPQGFRADLWARINRHFTLERVSALTEIQSIDNVCIRTRNWQWGWGTADREAPTQRQRADIRARWTVYQELKPLYDLVDGAQGEAAMPRDVEAEWDRQSLWSAYNFETDGDWVFGCDSLGVFARSAELDIWRAGPSGSEAPLRNFAAVLDAVAERRVTERMRGQAHTVTPVQPTQLEPVLDETALRALILCLPNIARITSRIERGSRQRDRYIVRVQLVDHDVTLDRALATQIPRNVHVHCEGRGDGGQRGISGTAAIIFSPTGNREDAVVPPIQQPRVNVEPRRFADVRPDRHGWRWWRDLTTGDCFTIREGVYVRRFDVIDPWLVLDLSAWLDRTIIPTDEQGNPVSWEAAGFAAEDTRTAQESVQQAASDAPARSVGDIEWTVTGQTGTLRDVHTARIRQLDRFVAEAIQAGNTGGFSIEPPTPPRPGQFSNNPATPPLTPEGLLAAMQNYAVPGIHATVGTGAKPAQTEVMTTLPLPLPRFTADELDDVDHSKTTKLDEATLRRGKLPTVEQIAKYREVRAKRTGGTVADALKESRIDCEVAQYVLERWAGGLGDAQVRSLFGAVGCVAPLAGALPSALKTFDPTKDRVDHCAQHWLRNLNPVIDTSEKPSPTVQQERQEAEEQRQRLAKLRQRLAAERAAQPAEDVPTDTSRFNLIEPDPQADPAASIRAWEARQAAAKVRPVAVPPRIVKPAATPRRPAIEVIDAQTDGLSGSTALAVLLGRAMNAEC